MVYNYDNKYLICAINWTILNLLKPARSIKGDKIMASILIQQQVKDFSAWKKVYDSKKDFRASNGALSSQVFHDAGDPNKVTVVLKWDSLAKAQKYAASPELKANQELAGAQGIPSVSFLEEA